MACEITCEQCGEPVVGAHVFAIVRYRRGGWTRQVRLHEACAVAFELRERAEIVEQLSTSGGVAMQDANEP